ncbi:MAG TPA: hypothetical protein DCY01_00005, partial [Ruminococcus sp.]|nr:hypothetical protein [Ruminococcus sp.]
SLRVSLLIISLFNFQGPMFTLHKKNLILSFVLRGFVVFLRGTFSIIYFFQEKSTPFFKKIQFFQKKF